MNAWLEWGGFGSSFHVPTAGDVSIDERVMYR
jgi:hypothetical protein